MQQALFPEETISMANTPTPDPRGLGKDLIILLDLNYTLCSNSWLKRKQRGPYREKIPQETYHRWLVDLIRPHTVLLCTVRGDHYQDITLRNIANKLDGWQPADAFFNPDHDLWKGNIVKDRYLREQIYPEYGTPDDGILYFALESAQATRAMYRTHGIPAVRVSEAKTGLPLPPDYRRA